MMCTNTACKGHTSVMLSLCMLGRLVVFGLQRFVVFGLQRCIGHLESVWQGLQLICFPKAIISSTSITKELPYMFSSSQNGLLQRATLFTLWLWDICIWHGVQNISNTMQSYAGSPLWSMWVASIHRGDDDRTGKARVSNRVSRPLFQLMFIIYQIEAHS